MLFTENELQKRSKPFFLEKNKLLNKNWKVEKRFCCEGLLDNFVRYNSFNFVIIFHYNLLKKCISNYV